MKVRDLPVLTEAVLALVAAGLALRVLPFRRLVSRVDPIAPGAGEGHRPPREPAALRVAWAIDRAARRVPGSTCLVRALAAGWMLRRRGETSLLHLGVDMVDGLPVAHAWLESGDGFVCGGPEARRFTPLAAFPNRPAKPKPSPAEAAASRSPRATDE